MSPRAAVKPEAGAETSSQAPSPAASGGGAGHGGVVDEARRRRERMVWTVSLTIVAVGLLSTVMLMGARLEAATWGLLVAAGAMVFCLRALYRMATVLSRPAVDVVLEQEGVAMVAGRRELREERRRVLRAINELQFDYEMGKLSQADYDKVRADYELRAVEVMRALDAQEGLHPALEQELRRRGLLDGSTGEPAADDADGDGNAADAADAGGESPLASEVPTDVDDAPSAQAEEGALPCAACGGVNDPDAKFCKHCGARIEASSDAADDGSAAEDEAGSEEDSESDDAAEDEEASS